MKRFVSRDEEDLEYIMEIYVWDVPDDEDLASVLCYVEYMKATDDKFEMCEQLVARALYPKEAL